jgi:hypothetical protein
MFLAHTNIKLKLQTCNHLLLTQAMEDIIEQQTSDVLSLREIKLDGRLYWQRVLLLFGSWMVLTII